MKRQHKGILPVLLLCAAAAMTTSCIFAPEEEESSDPKEGLSLVWSDEFDYTGVPDTTKWKYQTGASGWGNNELQDYIDNTTTATTAVVSDGTLKINAFKEGATWKSARLNSKESWTYGCIEARLKVTDKKGAWPAFWMMPQDSVYGGWPASGEMDIMENAPSTCTNHRVFSTLHASGHYGGNGASIGSKIIENLSSAWHTFAIRWTDTKITAYYDDEAVGTYYKEDKTSTDWPYDNDFYIILNLAIGGDLGGTSDAASLGSAVYEIDYVRVYQ